MLNLILRLDIPRHLIETFHYDEYTGSVLTCFSDIKVHSNLDFLKQVLVENNTFSTFNVEEVKSHGGLRLVYEDIGSTDITDIDYIDTYEPYYSLIGLIRYLITLDCKVLITRKEKDYVLNLNTLTISNSSFGLYIRYLEEVDTDKYTWRTYTLFYNDGEGKWVGRDDIVFLVPQSPLGEYEPYVSRLGKYIHKTSEKSREYDMIEVTSELNMFDEKPLSFTCIESLGAFQFMYEVHELVNPIIRECVFDTELDIVSYPSSGYREVIAHHAYINMYGNKKINNTLRDKYSRELKSIFECGLEVSTLWRHDSMFLIFKRIIESFSACRNNGNNPIFFYNSLQNTRALMALTILEAKLSLFYYDKEFLLMLSRNEFLNTNITGYNISVKVGGSSGIE